MVKYVREDRAVTTGSTRLARLCDQVADYLRRTHDPRSILRASDPTLNVQPEPSGDAGQGDDALIREMLGYYIDRTRIAPSSELRVFTKEFIARARREVPESTVPAQAAGEWVRCEDRLPEAFALVQFDVPGVAGPTIGKFNGSRWMALFDLSKPGLVDYGRNEPRQWRPLLPPPPARGKL
jgi:hypothetical protein